VGRKEGKKKRKKKKPLIRYLETQGPLPSPFLSALTDKG
jgi:hypothetical protein